MEGDALYFAYGSNHNPDRMKKRGVIFSKRELAELPGYEFLLNKTKMDGTAAANIRANKDKTVYGILYTCSPCVFQKLDVFEGVAQGHYTREKVTVLVDGVEKEAITYMGCKAYCDDNLRKVTREYLGHILCGRDLLPPEYTKFIESFSSWYVD